MAAILYMPQRDDESHELEIVYQVKVKKIMQFKQTLGLWARIALTKLGVFSLIFNKHNASFFL